jgi:hypothetical protein
VIPPPSGALSLEFVKYKYKNEVAMVKVINPKYGNQCSGK